MAVGEDTAYSSEQEHKEILKYDGRYPCKKHVREVQQCCELQEEVCV